MSCLESKRSVMERERARLALQAAAFHPLAHPALAASHLSLVRTASGYAPLPCRSLIPHAAPRHDGLHRLSLVQVHPPRNPNKPLTPFYIADILSDSTKPKAGTDSSHLVGGNQVSAVPSSPHQAQSCPAKRASPHPAARGIIRPWTGSTDEDDDDEDHQKDDGEVDDDEVEIEVDEVKLPAKDGKSCSPLDALFEMTSKTFDAREGRSQMLEDADKKDALSLFAKTQPPKKRRKSRTAFTNQQIYELEKRFLYQKYLTPADRDDIAQNLGLTNAQVITWFQNRRAKLKRDLEEIKNDVTAAKSLSPSSSPGLDARSDVASPPMLDNAMVAGRIITSSHPLANYVPEIGEIYKQHSMVQAGQVPRPRDPREAGVSGMMCVSNSSCSPSERINNNSSDTEEQVRHCEETCEPDEMAPGDLSSDESSNQTLSQSDMVDKNEDVSSN